MAESIENPIINGPYDAPTCHFALGDKGPTGEIIEGRRPSLSFIPIAPARKRAGRAVQEMLDLGDRERSELNKLVNDIRRSVALWRQRDYERATPVSRKLLRHWADPTRDNRVLFCQREAAETAVFLAEVAGRHGYPDWRRRLDGTNAEYNSGLPRIALKMATGSGKTVVMAMLIAWQSINKAFTPRDTRFTNRFLVIAPGITIRDRLRVLQPGDPDNYYAMRDLVPADLSGALDQAQIVVTNYHAFIPRDAKEMKGVSATTRKVLLAGKDDPFKETPDAVVARVLRGFSGRRGEIVVLNDEAHHCYQDKPVASSHLTKEESDANTDARRWFLGIQAVAKKIGVKQVYDMSATPFYLSGSGYSEGHLFPWTVSDFSLMDAIESGIVKIPRTPVDDDAVGDLVTYLHLWTHIGDKLPKKRGARLTLDEWSLPEALEAALHSLYRSYQTSYRRWDSELRPIGHTPPVFIVVCPNTVVSKLVYDWIAGRTVERDGETAHVPGQLPLFSNVEQHRMRTRPRTILVDSAQLESGEALKPEFKSAAAEEIEAFKAQFRLDNPGADTEKLTDEDILREVMNTVGKPRKLGAEIRCVVSVAMLTEGWDANTVSHILGIRAFGSQLLCEQVVGRGLRRRSYDVDENGRFSPEYANVYGIPFAFIPSDRTVVEPKPKPPALRVCSLPDRSRFRIEFPRLDGYRLEIPDERLMFDTAGTPRFVIGANEVPTWTESAGIVGASDRDDSGNPELIRRRTIAFALADHLLRRHLQQGDNRQPWLFPQLVRIAEQWLDECAEVRDGRNLGYLYSSSELRARACEHLYDAIATQKGSRRERLRPILRRFDPVGSTASVEFLTRKEAVEVEKSEVSHVVLDGPGGNTWEQLMAEICEHHRDIAAFVKNDHLGFEIPYIHNGRSHSYLPDFILKLAQRDLDDIDRHLIVEISGGQKAPGPTQEKARTARNSWCPAVNNHGGFGRWGYVEITDMPTAKQCLDDAIDRVYADDPIIGDPDLLDYNEVRNGA